MHMLYHFPSQLLNNFCPGLLGWRPLWREEEHRQRQDRGLREAGKVNVGDVLMRVNEEDVTGQSLQELRRVIPGPLNSKVLITFGRDGNDNVYDVELARSSTSGGGGGRHAMDRGMPPPQDMRDTGVQQAQPGE
eukprot:2037807-Rhodomonas_salina.4